MSIFDTIKNAAHDHPTVKNMADKLGIDQETAEKAIAALAHGHQQDGDTVQAAAQESGIDQSVLTKVMEQVGGESALTGFMQILDRDHDGNAMNDVAGMAGKLFGKK